MFKDLKSFRRVKTMMNCSGDNLLLYCILYNLQKAYCKKKSYILKNKIFPRPLSFLKFQA